MISLTKYGRIKHLTLGQGLLMDNYDSGTRLVSSLALAKLHYWDI